MKTVIKSLFVLSTMVLFSTSCEKENGEDELSISFKNGGTYTSESISLPAGTEVTIGIEAEAEKEKDPLIKFNISEAVDGEDNHSVYTEDIETTVYEHDHTFILDTVPGTQHTYTFTVTNRDGFNAQESLTISVE